MLRSMCFPFSLFVQYPWYWSWWVINAINYTHWFHWWDTPGSVNDDNDVVSLISIAILLIDIAFSQISQCQNSSMQESQYKQIPLVERSQPTNFKQQFWRWCHQITMRCKSSTLEKYISYRMKWFFCPLFCLFLPFCF